MKHIYTLSVVLFLTCLQHLSAQSGRSIDLVYTDDGGNTISYTLDYSRPYQGRNSYVDLSGPAGIIWDNNNKRWALLGPGQQLLFYSLVNPRSNPPELVTGNWQAAIPGYSLGTLSGSGTYVMLESAIAEQKDVACNGESNGSVSLTTSEGLAPYKYKWSNGATTAELTGVPIGSYSVTVTDGDIGSVILTTTINEPTALAATATVDGNVDCNGGMDGGATASGTGGVAPYSYSWSNGATTATITNVPAGTYDLTVTDANGCTANASATITQPTPLLATTRVDQSVDCNGGDNGAATVEAVGGNSPYTYVWTNGATTAEVTGLQAGTYEVTVSDANACEIIESVTITEPAALNVAATITNVACNGEANGEISLNVADGVAPYAYVWADGATDRNRTGLTAGEYTVTVTDAKGCTRTETISVSQPMALTSTVTHSDASCNGAADGTATVNPVGGTAPYTIEWSTGATTATANNLPAGNHTVTIRDANGCEAANAVTISEPTALKASVTSQTNVSCNGGTDGAITTQVEGGTAPYTFAWSNNATTADLTGLRGGNYVLTVTDANGCRAQLSVTITQPNALSAVGFVDNTIKCNGDETGALSVFGNLGTPFEDGSYQYLWSNGATEPFIGNLPGGTYSATVTDANGCTASVEIDLTDPNQLGASIDAATDVSCSGAEDGSATVTVTNGSSPYSYTWSNGVKKATIENLSGGDYTVTVTDRQGCSVTETVTIAESSPVAADITVDNTIDCNGDRNGALSVAATGGEGDYTYQWNNGATTAALTDVPAGNYRVEVKDGAGCTAEATVQLKQNGPISLAMFNDNDASCYGKADGAASVFATGGTGEMTYTYAWSNGGTDYAVTDLAAGTYTLTVTDANNCTAEASVMIAEPAAFTAVATETQTIACAGGTDGAATVSLTGNNDPFLTYAWSNGATTPTAGSLASGSYNVTVTDRAGCTAETSVAITEPEGNIAALATTPDDGSANGTASVTVNGDAQDYTFAWNTEPAATSAEVSGLAAGEYMVTVTAADGCVHEEMVTVGFVGDACTTAMSIDSLLAGDLDVAQLSRSFSNAAYAMDSITNDSLTKFFNGNDTLYHPVWFRFTGDGNIYHLRAGGCEGEDALTDMRAALFTGDCGMDSLLRRSDNYSETDSMPLIEIQTEDGVEYTLLVDAGDTTRGTFCLSVTQMATVPVRSVAPLALRVYPNPTGGVVRYDNIEARQITVSDSYGRRVLQVQPTGSEVDLSGLPTGVYYLQLIDLEDKRYISRVVKQ